MRHSKGIQVGEKKKKEKKRSYNSHPFLSKESLKLQHAVKGGSMKSRKKCKQ
jgi:hypothetical protein